MPSPTETSGAHGFRPTGVAVALRVSSLALVASGYLALVATPRFSTGMAAIPCVMFVLVPLGEWLDGRFAHYRRLWRWGLFRRGRGRLRDFCKIHTLVIKRLYFAIRSNLVMAGELCCFGTLIDFGF